MTVFQSIQPLINDWPHWLKVVRLRLEYLFSTISISVSRTQDILSGECSLSDPGMVCALLEEEEDVLRFHAEHAAFASSLEKRPLHHLGFSWPHLFLSLYHFLFQADQNPPIFFSSILPGTFPNVSTFTKGPACTDMQKKKKNNNNSNKFRLLSPNSPTKDMNASALFLLGASPFLSWLLYGAETFSWECAREVGRGKKCPSGWKKGKKNWWSAEQGFV